MGAAIYPHQRPAGMVIPGYVQQALVIQPCLQLTDAIIVPQATYVLRVRSPLNPGSGRDPPKAGTVACGLHHQGGKVY